jgi:hypothetical protein
MENKNYLQNSTIILIISNTYGKINHTTDGRSDLIGLVLPEQETVNKPSIALIIMSFRE